MALGQDSGVQHYSDAGQQALETGDYAQPNGAYEKFGIWSPESPKSMPTLDFYFELRKYATRRSRNPNAPLS